MMSRLIQRIAIILIILLAPIVYIFHNKANVAGGLQLLDALTHTPLAENKPLEIKPVEVKPTEPATEEPIDFSICTVTNPLSRLFIDLKPLSSFGNEGKPFPLGVKGYDSGVNFTLGICSSPMKKNHDKSEIRDEVDSTRIGAYFKDAKTNQYVSIGEFSTQPIFRGKKLTLTYENGSYCNLRDEAGERVRRSTIITLVCDRETQKKATVAYIGNSHECDYMFEVRSHHVCPTADKDNNLNAFWIFLIIVLATVVGYFSGGILYRNMKKTAAIRV